MNGTNYRATEGEFMRKPRWHGAFMLPALAALFWFFWSTAVSAAVMNEPLGTRAGQISVKQRTQSGIFVENARPAGGTPENARPAGAEPAQERRGESIFSPDEAWRIRIFDAAVVNGPMVLLGEIAEPVGTMPAALWQELAGRELWLSPEDNGRPVNLTRPRLQQAMSGGMGRDFAALCLYPPSIMLQRGGAFLDAPTVQNITVKTLTPYLAALPGEAELSDFRLPGNVFLAHAGQTLELDAPQKAAPGRLSLRYSIKELDGSVVRRLSGSVFIDCWAAVPTVTTPVNKGEVLRPEYITFTRKNLAYLREMPWNGRGGPWQAQRAIALDQPIMESDLGYVPTITKGALVKLVFAGGSVRLSATVEAMSDGVSGETIPVKNVQSKRQVYATIFDANTVLAHSGGMQPIRTAGRPEHLSDTTPVSGQRGDL